MVDTAPVRTDLWQVLSGRAVGSPLTADDPDLWEDLAGRLNVARARPRLRAGIEAVARTTVRGQPYVMLRSPDRVASYVRLSPEEWALAQEMDGTRSVAALVGVLATSTGALAPDRVTRVVADLGANRMLDELPVDAFCRLRGMRSGSRRSRLGRRLLDAARGRRMVLADVDRAVGVLYRAGGRLLFTAPAVVGAVLVAAVGLVLFLRNWMSGAESLFLQSGSYAAGGLILLGLNTFALLCHEIGHALATKHAGRRVPAVGVLMYFGIPSAFVDTTDIWMANRRQRLVATAAGPATALTLAGLAQVAAFMAPELAPLAFKLSFAWYLNALFNLNPLMALDGYYLAMDALEIHNLRARGIGFLTRTVRSRRIGWDDLDRESRYVAAYGAAAALWTVVFVFLATRIWRDRLSGLVAGLWHAGVAGRLLVVAFVLGLFAPVIWAVVAALSRRVGARRAVRERTHGLPARLDALRSSRLAALPAEALDALAAAASWSSVPSGAVVSAAGTQPGAVLVLTSGRAEGRRPGDPPATVRLRAEPGDVLGMAEVLAARVSALEWRAAADTRLLVLPGSDFTATSGPLLARPGLDGQAAEAALDASPTLASLTPHSRAELMSRMACVDVPPGKVVTVSDPVHAVLVGAGVLTDDDGRDRRRGDVLRAVDDEPLRLRTRTRASLWRLPDFGSLGAGAPAAASAAPPAGAHGGGGHPPVTPPPTDVPAGDDDADDRLWRRTRRLLVLLLLITLMSGATALAEPVPWSEVPRDRVLAVVARGSAEFLVGSGSVRLERGGRIALGADDRVEAGRQSTVHLVYAGGSRQVLCGGSRVSVTTVSRSRSGRTWLPAGGLHLHRGALLVDTSSSSAAFAPLDLQVQTQRLLVQTGGAAAAFDMTTRRVEIVSGDVLVRGGVTVAAVDCIGAGDDAGLGAPAPAPDSVVPAPHPPAPLPVTSGTPPAAPTPPPPLALATFATAGASAPPAAEPAVVPAPSLRPSPSPSALPSPSPSPASSPTPEPAPAGTASPSAAPAPGLGWVCSPTSMSFSAGSAAKTTCDVTSVNGFSGGVTFLCDGTPTGMTCAPSPTTAVLAAGETTSVSFSLSGGRGLEPGTYSVDAVARSDDGSIVRRVTLTVTVT